MDKNTIKKEIKAKFTAAVEKVNLKDIEIADVNGDIITAYVNIEREQVFYTVVYDLATGDTDISKPASVNIKKYLTECQPSDEQLKAGINASVIDSAIQNQLCMIKSDIITQRELEAMLFTDMVQTSMSRIDDSKEDIAKCIAYIYHNQLYTAMGYDNIYDYGAEVFSLSRGSVNNYLNVVKRFYDAAFLDSIEEFNTAHVQPHFELFTFTQLNIMKNLTDSQIESLDIDYSMSCRQIAKKIQTLKQLEAKQENENIIKPVTTSEKTDETGNTAADADAEADTEDGTAEDYIPNAKGNKPNATLVVTGYSGLLASESLLQSIMKTNKFRVEFYRVED